MWLFVGLTYRDAGVDIDQQERVISALVSQLKFARKGIGSAVKLPGGFAGLISLGGQYLAMTTDGVGTKLLVASAMHSWEGVGFDCVAVNVNDLLCVGAEPVALVDYIATDRYDPEIAEAIGRGLDRGAAEANVTVIGGEFACVPDLVRHLDLSGTALGFVDRRDLIKGASVKPGDLIIGLPSSGLHANGFTLARKILEKAGVGLHEMVPGLGGTIGDLLLTPTNIYVCDVLKVLRRHVVHGLAHITGSGLWNILRLNDRVGYLIDEPIQPQPIFRKLQELGGVEDREMYQTFNMGMGFALVLPAREAHAALDQLEGGKIVGSVVKGQGVRLEPLGIEFGV